MEHIYPLTIILLLAVILVLLLARRDGEKSAKRMEALLKEEIDGLQQQNYQLQADHADRILRQMLMLNEAGSQRMEILRQNVDDHLQTMRQSNDKALADMRFIVDEKLHTDLERRLGQSFSLINERLEQVYKGLGEMQNLAAGVGDLKKVLSNVKTRGIWGEVSLGNLLAQMLSPGQYAVNAAVNPEHGELRVEYAVILPGRGETPVYLPIDAKFPLAGYQALLQAEEAGDTSSIAACRKALCVRIKECAKDVNQKYIAPPYTTDFALIYLPVEGLYSELIRQADLVEALQREYRVMLAGPTTVSALLNSLQLGFRSIAVEQRAEEIWLLLNEVKHGFADFGIILEKIQRKLQEAANGVDTAAAKTRGIERRLNKVSQLSAHAGALADENGNDNEVRQ
ncbi:MAG: DNA recombination protein RmuC [Firmicutes bacterium]|nr:DNA recombination protein RmuC [Bacillota bacterium]